AITDFVFMVRGSSYMFVTGPNVVKTVTHEEVTFEELGGADTHASKSGVAHFACENEIECLLHVRKLMNFLPSNNRDGAPVLPTTDTADRVCHNLDTMIPENPNKPYDMRDVIRAIVDE